MRPAAPPRHSAYPLVPMRDALRTIRASLSPITETERVAPAAAVARTLAADVAAPAPLPPFRASIKDGYAVSSAAPWAPGAAFAVVGEALAGAPAGARPAVRPGVRECVYITTGAPLPEGADAVVMVEVSEPVPAGGGGGGGAAVTLREWVAGPGVDVRAVGCDVAEGEVVLRRGDVVGAAEVGILIACGVRSVDVVRRVVVGVMSTGDEVVDAAAAAGGGGALGAGGRIIDSNRPMLLAAVAETLPWCVGVDLGIVRDEHAAVKAAMEDALARCDVVLTSGGVSMGSRDVVKPVLAEVATVHFGRVCMKPGKPLTFATAAARNACAVGLPGNPVSAFVCFHLAVATAAKTLAGWPEEAALGTLVRATLAHDFALDPARPEYHRVNLRWTPDGYVATSTGAQASSRLLSARSAHALLALPARAGAMRAGAVCDAYLLKHPR